MENNTFYRSILLGRALMEVVDEKVKSNSITSEQGTRIAQKFDSVIPKLLKKNNTNISFRGDVLTYNHAEGVWKFLVEDFEVSINNHNFHRIPNVMIVACDSELGMESGGGGRKKKIRKI